MISRLFLLVTLCGLASCQTRSYAPPPQAAAVEQVEIEVRDFAGRPEVIAHVKGSLSTSAAQLIDARQSRVERTLIVEVLEQTPRGADRFEGLTAAPPFQASIPVEVLGLDPGPCILYLNGFELPFEIPRMQASPAYTDLAAAPSSPITLVDEFIPIEDTVPLSTGMRSVAPGAAIHTTPLVLSTQGTVSQ